MSTSSTAASTGHGEMPSWADYEPPAREARARLPRSPPVAGAAPGLAPGRAVPGRSVCRGDPDGVEYSAPGGLLALRDGQELRLCFVAEEMSA